MPVKIDPYIVEELAAVDLVIWEAKHPRERFYNTKTMKESTREDKTWVVVQLAGPGSEGDCRAGDKTLRDAVDRAMAYHFPEKLHGVKGALLKLDRAVLELNTVVKWERFMAEEGYEGDRDDFIPF